VTKPKALTYAHARYHDDDDDIIYPSVPLKASSSSSSSSGQPTTAEDLINALTNLGFDSAHAFVIHHGFERVNAALSRALSRPPGTIRNLPGYIRSITTQRGPIAPPQEPPQPQQSPPPSENRYLKGKYGHLVRH